jgi:hypothetical protein
MCSTGLGQPIVGMCQAASVDELQLLLQTFLQPDSLAGARPQDIANVVWALGELCQLPGWQGVVSEQDMQQLLGKQHLQVLAAVGQSAANVLVGLARMAATKVPVVDVQFARESSKQLLALVGPQLGSWSPQHISNAIWACGELGLVDSPFVAAAIAAAPRWLPASVPVGLRQAVSACVVLEYRDEAFMQACLQRALQLLGQQQQQASNRQGRSSRPLPPGDKDGLAAYCASAVARLDLQSLAGTAVELVSRSGIGQRSNTHPGNLSKLWLFHSWLLQLQLLDGKGLSGLLTKQQLQQGAKAAKFGSQARAPVVAVH